MKARLLALGALLLFASLAQAAPNSLRVVLPNGMSVIAVEDKSSAVAAFHLAIRFNPAAIPAGKTGLAALTQQVLSNEARELLKHEPYMTLGQDIQATRSSFSLNTEMDYCEMRGQLVTAELASALQLAAKLAFAADTYSTEQVARAREILSNDAADSASDVVESTYYRFLRAAYGNTSPYARPVQGTEETLAALKPGDVNAFRATFLGANNASLCLVGPSSPQALLALAKAAFGECRQATTRVRNAMPSLLGVSRISVAALPRWRGASVMIGVPTPQYGTDGYLQAQLIYSLLEGKQGRLQKDRELVSNFGLNQLLNRDKEPVPVNLLPPMAAPRPFLILHMLTAPQMMEQVRRSLLGHLLAFTEKPPTEAELTVAKTRLINAHALLDLSRVNLAKSLNCHEIYGRDYRDEWSAPARISAVTGADLQRLAKQYFITHAIGVILPGDEAQEAVGAEG